MTTTDALDTNITEVQTQLGRADTKASMLLAGSLTAVSVGIAVLAKTALPGPAAASAFLTVGLIAVAVILLITAVRPALGGNHGFVRWAAAATPTDLIDDLTTGDREHATYLAQRLMSLSRTLRRKYRVIRLATDLMRAALLIAVLTATLTALA